MRQVLFRCSSIGRLMTEPKSIDPTLITPDIQKILDSKKRTDEEKVRLEALKLRTLSEGAKTYVRDLVRQEIWGVDFDSSSKYTEKGIAVEGQALELINRVRGLDLSKNTERRSDDLLTGEADTIDTLNQEGWDVKSSWSLQTFPVFEKDCYDPLYEYQMRGYMRLWDMDRWHVAYAMVDTPDALLGRYEPLPLHLVSHIPDYMRLTIWTIERDRQIERQIVIKLQAARNYYEQCIKEFDQTHQPA